MNGHVVSLLIVEGLLACTALCFQLVNIVVAPHFTMDRQLDFETFTELVTVLFLGICVAITCYLVLLN
jgi:hypothetical protein